MKLSWRTSSLVLLIVSHVTSTLDYNELSMADLIHTLRKEYYCDNFLISRYILELQSLNSLVKYLNYTIQNINMELKERCPAFAGTIKEQISHCHDRPMYKSCLETANQNSRVYRLKSKSNKSLKSSFLVYCLKDDEGGEPWMIIQRRVANDITFNQAWKEYEAGFGNPYGSYWLGLKELYAFVNSQPFELWIQLQDQLKNETIYAKYDEFVIGNANKQFALIYLGKLNGTDGFLKNGVQFSTKDRRNDARISGPNECFSGWWFGKTSNCRKFNPNGKYFVNTTNRLHGIHWYENYAFSYIHMAIREKTLK